MTPDQIQNLMDMTMLTGRDMALLIGTSPMSPSRWRRGEDQPQGENLKRLTELWNHIMGISDDELHDVYMQIQDARDLVGFWRGIMGWSANQ